MAWKILNIGKANARIEELEKELAAAKTAPLGDSSAQLADAVASNEEISKQLETAKADLIVANATIGSLTSKLETAQGEVNALGAAVKTACDSLKISIPAGTNTAGMIALLQNSIPGLASAKAAEITAAVGAPPAPAAPKEAKSGATGEPAGAFKVAACAKQFLQSIGYQPKQK